MTAPDPVALYQQMLQELSGSGTPSLLDNDGTKFTLRGAIDRILWKVNFLLPLINRPVAPTQKDDLYGHVLSLRAEHLQTQALLSALISAVAPHVDQTALLAAVKENLNVNA